MWHNANRGCGPGGHADRWERFAMRFAENWERAQQRGGHRRRRMFDGGELRLVLLKLIEDQPRHGYELIRAIEELTGGAYAPSPGVIYPTLTMLTEQGLIAEDASADSRKRFAITPDGASHVAENREQVEALIARLASVGEHRGRADKAPIRRAMGNLKVALQDRLTRGELSDDQLHDIAGLIDRAAQQIERLK